MSDSLIVDVAIGLVFAFGMTAAVTSGLTEGLARFLGLRGDYLLRGIRALVDGSAMKATDPPAPLAGGAAANPQAGPAPAAPLAPSVRLMQSPLLRSTGSQQFVPDTSNGVPGGRAALRKLPSYISSPTFASAVIDILVPDAAGATTMDVITAGIDAEAPGIFKDSLLAIAKRARSDVAQFEAGLERWYDDHMDRVSGWYKRHTRWISLLIGVVLVVLFNVNTVTIARDLYADQALRESVVSQAFATAQCNGTTPAGCLADARKQIGGLRSSGLPIGWAEVAECKAPGAHCGLAARLGLADPSGGASSDARFLLIVLLGWLITALALLPGARFWFNLLSRIGSMRSSGPKPARS